jgi:flagellar biosynthetic protein FliP
MLMMFCSTSVFADTPVLLDQLAGQMQNLAPELKTLTTLTLLSFVPIFFVAMTAFTRIIIVLALLRHALGLQQTPPNIVLLTLALFLTFFTMAPVFEQANVQGLQPFLTDQLTAAQAFQQAVQPFKEFMLLQTREQDFVAIASMHNQIVPTKLNDISLLHLVPAFMLSELTTAFQIAFVVFLPFLLIDLVVASLLMAMGMMMVPPVTVSLPLKIMVFVLIDGWALLSRSLVSSFS